MTPSSGRAWLAKYTLLDAPRRTIALFFAAPETGRLHSKVLRAGDFCFLSGCAEMREAWRRRPRLSGRDTGWTAPRELSLAVRLVITRVSEHAALSIANRRLLLALRGQANTDGRTGLTNSRAFDEALERVLANRADRDPVAVLMLDLDHFKEFNDRYGHPAGDEALRAFAHLLRSSVRDQDIVARYGGEEFAVCLPGLTARAAVEVAERMRERTEAAIIALAPGLTGRLTVSIGIAAAPEDGSQPLMLLKAADEALYRAKLAGRNKVVSRDGWLGSDRGSPEAEMEELAAEA